MKINKLRKQFNSADLIGSQERAFRLHDPSDPQPCTLPLSMLMFGSSSASGGAVLEMGRLYMASIHALIERERQFKTR